MRQTIYWYKSTTSLNDSETKGLWSSFEFFRLGKSGLNNQKY
jgi:hypothetical protein